MADRYRKKPVIIEARQWNPANPGRVLSWLREHRCHHQILEGGRLGVGTPESGNALDHHVGKPGDWVLRGVQGEFYVCDAYIFAETYEPVGEDTDHNLDNSDHE